MKICLLFLIAFWHQSSAIVPCSYPPPVMCSSLESATKCGITRQCADANFTLTAPKVEVDLYYESLCSASRRLITQIVYPTWMLLKGIMNVNLIPYGNTVEFQDGDHYSHVCSHGVFECLGDTLETCILNMTNKDMAFQIINCMETALDVVSSTQTCVQLYSADLGWDEVLHCAMGHEGNMLVHENAIRTAAEKPPNLIPYMVLDGVQTEDGAFTSFFNLVCDSYQGLPPPICGGNYETT